MKHYIKFLMKTIVDLVKIRIQHVITYLTKCDNKLNHGDKFVNDKNRNNDQLERYNYTEYMVKLDELGDVNEIDGDDVT